MSFGGGGSQQYFIDYIIRVKNEGVGAGGGAFSQINQGMKQTQAGALNVTAAMEKMKAANEKVIQAGQGISKAMKGMAFGFLGLTTAGAEFFGMMSMWKATQQGVKEAQAEANKALAEGGKNSKEYKDAMMDVAKANRWAQMTFRNLMLSAFDLVPFFVLSVNGIIKLRSAYKLLREAQLEQKAMKEVLAAAGIKEAAAAQLQTASYGSLTAAQRKLKAEQALGISTLGAKTTATNVATAANVSHNGSLITQIPLLGKQATATNVVTAATTRLSKAMRVLQIAMKIAIPLVLIEIGSQAFVNNWGGFADKLNAVGVAAGNAVPQLKGVFDIVGKLGRSVAAIFTGNFEDISEIWAGKDGKGGFVPEELSENAKKEFDETIQKMEEFKNSSMDIFKELGSADKGGLKDLMKTLGVTTGDSNIKGVKKEFKELTDILDETFTNLEETQQRFKTLEGFSILESIEGFANIDPKVVQKIRYALSSSLDDIIGESDDDIFSQLAEVVKKNAKKSAPEFNAAVAQFVADHKGIEDAARKLGYPDLADYFAGLRADLQEQMRAGLGNLLTNESDEAEVWKDNWWDEQFKEDGDTGGGIFSSVIEKIKTGAVELGAAIEGINWTELGAKVSAGLGKIFNVTNAQKVGNFIRINFIDPIWAELGKVLTTAITEFQKDPIGFIGAAVNKISEIPAAFIAGVLGFESASDMDTKIEQSMIKFFEGVPILQQLKMMINDPVGSIIGIITGTLTGGTSIESVDISEHTLGPELKKSLGIKSQGFFDEYIEKSGIKDAIDGLPTIDEMKERILGMPGVKEFLDFNNAFNKAVDGGIMGFIDWLKSLGQTASGDTGGSIGGSPRKSFELNDADFDKLFAENTITIPSLRLESDSVIIGPAPNATPTIDPTFSSTIPPIPVTGNVIPVATWGTGEGLGKQENAPPGTVNQHTQSSSSTSSLPPVDLVGRIVSIDTTAMVTVLQTINETFGNTMLELMELWIATMTNMSSLANTTVQAIALVFQGMAINMEAQFNATEVNWNNATTNMLSDAESAGGSIQEIFQSVNEQLEEEFNSMEVNWNNATTNMLSDAESAFEQILDSWSEVLDDMVSNTDDAVDDINNSLDNIKREVVTVHRIITIGSLAKGGPMSIGSGVVSAAGGKMLTTNGPGLYQLGDNPGGKESVWAIPHDNPSPTVSNINRMYGTQIRRVGGDASLNQNITVVIPGNDIVNDKKLNKRIRGTIGRRMDRFGS